MRSASAYSFVCAISAPSSSQLPGRSGATRSACAFAAIAFSTALSWADFEDFAAAAVFAPKPPPDEAARFGFFAAFTFAFARAAAEEEPMRRATTTSGRTERNLIAGDTEISEIVADFAPSPSQALKAWCTRSSRPAAT